MKRTAQFKPPTPQEVDEYSRQLGNHIDGEHFCAYYGMAGWKLKSGKPMASWQDAVKYWITIRKNKNKQPNTDKTRDVMTAIDKLRASER